jgi:hypothetical protein
MFKYMRHIKFNLQIYTLLLRQEDVSSNKVEPVTVASDIRIARKF